MKDLVLKIRKERSQIIAFIESEGGIEGEEESVDIESYHLFDDITTYFNGDKVVDIYKEWINIYSYSDIKIEDEDHIFKIILTPEEFIITCNHINNENRLNIVMRFSM